MATCTGLSIILVDACRSVGIPARGAGTALWANKRGNHTWAEVFVDGEWKFTGADEYDKKGLNRGWFTGDASKAIADDWKHAIWATSWKPQGHHFPMVWDLKNKSVGAVNVTERYAAKADPKSGVFVRLREKAGGKRLVAKVSVDHQTVTTKAGRTDMNDMPSINLAGAGPWNFAVQVGEELKVFKVEKASFSSGTLDLVWDQGKKVEVNVGEQAAEDELGKWLQMLPEERHLSVPKMELDQASAKKVADRLWTQVKKDMASLFPLELKDATKNGEIKMGEITAGGKTMKYLVREIGEEPKDGRSLWISMHGGGGAPARVNDGQWKNQIQLYSPKEGIYIAPRAPTNTWNLWHEGHIDDLFDALIAQYVAQKGVNPNKVYLMGYSAGGDGVYQLAPRTADRYAAAAMMAGHPNDASPLGLRNLPFRIFMGANDAAYKRNQIAAEWGEKLKALQKKDPKGYEHGVTIYEGLGHWMERKDAEAVPWMAGKTRNPWPKKIVWCQSGRTHERFYWLSLPKGSLKKGLTVTAEVKGQIIEITGRGEGTDDPTQ